MNAPDRMDAVRLPEGVAKISIRPDEKVPNAAIFTVACEDHTVGNLLRMELFRDSKVKFSGYKHPHPLDNTIVVRIQAAPGVLPGQSFIGAANRLEQEYRLLQTKFMEEVHRVRTEAAALE